MSGERQWIVIEDFRIDLTKLTDVELEQHMNKLRFTRTHDQSYSSTSPLELGLHLILAAAEKNSRSSARLAKTAIGIALLGLVIAIVGIWR